MGVLAGYHEILVKYSVAPGTGRIWCTKPPAKTARKGASKSQSLFEHLLDAPRWYIYTWALGQPAHFPQLSTEALLLLGLHTSSQVRGCSDRTQAPTPFPLPHGYRRGG